MRGVALKEGPVIYKIINDYFPFLETICCS
jgi:hypothetical protein